jgi:hypothetical protein
MLEALFAETGKIPYKKKKLKIMVSAKRASASRIPFCQNPPQLVIDDD